MILSNRHLRYKSGPYALLWLAAAALLAAFVAGPMRGASAQAEMDVMGESVEVAFGDSLVFTARLILPDEEGAVMLFVQPREGFQTSSVELSPGITGRIRHELELGSTFFPPFSDVQYWYQWEGLSGETLVSPTFSFKYEDNRFNWRTIESAPIRLHWVEGDLAFARQALDVARESFNAIEEELPFGDNGAARDWIDVYVYRTGADLQSALSLGGENWLAGHADPQLGVLLVSIPPGPEAALEMERQIPHEIAHVMLYRHVGPEYKDIPVWLNEGFASLSELYPNPNYPFLLNSAYEEELLFSMDDLCRTFPATASDTVLAYAQAASFTNFIHDEYGKSGVNALINEYADGKSCERGAEAAVGKTLSALERDWRQVAFGEDAWKGLIPWLGIFALIFVPLGITLFFIRKPPGK
ncbi:MAG: peptidase MA family metallohydrolase [Anaerolineales bacterium]|nr:peptidase MA family metallohydrolase [Anaerolineales bacterium]